TITFLNAFPSEAPFGAQVVLLAQVVVDNGSVVSSGAVQFIDATNDVNLGTSLVTNGQAKLATTALSLQEHLIQANYLGNKQFLSSTGSAEVSIDPAATTTTVDANPAVSAFGQPVTFT